MSRSRRAGLSEEGTAIAKSPAGAEFHIRVQRAPRPGLWLHGPWRWWAMLTRDNSWWLTVDSSEVVWPVLRERFATEAEVSKRAKELSTAIRGGVLPQSGRIAWRRRWG